MTLLMLDTNVVSALLNGRTPPRLHYTSAISAGQSLALSSIVAHELWYGISKGGHSSKNEATLKALLAGPLTVLAFDALAARRAGQVRAHLSTAGTPIGPLDTLIAGHALELGATLVTSNSREFARVPGLALEDWSK